MTTQAGIHWQIENAEAFNASMNYSSILYRQWSGATQVGAYGNRRLTVYGSADCKTDEKPTFAAGSQADPAYGFGCWSPSEGSCGTVPYSMRSFKVGPGDNDESGACWVFTKEEVAMSKSASASVSGQYSAVAVVLAALSVVLWVMM